jgi:uncharacterized protein (UPF0332 family)
MDLRIRNYLERAENELIIAKANFELSINKDIKDKLNIAIGKTFFNDVISEAYYSIFYSAKAYLLSRGIETEAPEEHKKTYEEFMKLVENSELYSQLSGIYDDAISKAEELLKIFFTERKNRGRFTYNINANANLPFAEQSIKNARTFGIAIKSIINEDGNKR